MGERGLSDSLDAGDDTDAAVALNASDIVAAYWKGRRQPNSRGKKHPSLYEINLQRALLDVGKNLPSQP